MNFIKLQKKVAGWLSREPANFYTNNFDNLQQAINDSMVLAQRLVDFNLALTRGYLPLTSGTGNFLTGMLDGVGGTSVNVQKVHSVYTDSDYHIKLPLRTEDDHDRLGESNGGEYAYLEGSSIYHQNPTENSSGLYTKYFLQLQPMVADEETNFLTNYCHDWMALQAAFEMLHYIKEDERVQLSAGLLRYKWDAVVAWNDSFKSEQDLTLD